MHEKVIAYSKCNRSPGEKIVAKPKPVSVCQCLRFGVYAYLFLSLAALLVLFKQAQMGKEVSEDSVRCW